MVNCINLIIEMSPRFVLGRENVPCVAEVVNGSLKADCTDFNDNRKSLKILTNRNNNPLRWVHKSFYYFQQSEI